MENFFDNVWKTVRLPMAKMIYISNKSNTQGTKTLETFFSKCGSNNRKMVLI